MRRSSSAERLDEAVAGVGQARGERHEPRHRQQREQDQADADALAADEEVVDRGVGGLAAAAFADRLDGRLRALRRRGFGRVLAATARPPRATGSTMGRRRVSSYRNFATASFTCVCTAPHSSDVVGALRATSRPARACARSAPRSRPCRRSRATRPPAGRRCLPGLLVHRQDDDDHAVGREVLAVAQHDVVDVADAEAVDVDVVGVDALAEAARRRRRARARRRRSG